MAMQIKQTMASMSSIYLTGKLKTLASSTRCLRWCLRTIARPGKVWQIKPISLTYTCKQSDWESWPSILSSSPAASRAVIDVCMQVMAPWVTCAALAHPGRGNRERATGRREEGQRGWRSRHWWLTRTDTCQQGAVAARRAGRHRRTTCSWLQNRSK